MICLSIMSGATKRESFDQLGHKLCIIKKTVPSDSQLTGIFTETRRNHARKHLEK